MYRENIFQFMQDGEKTLYIPKNGGLNKYVRDLLPAIGINAPEQVAEVLRMGRLWKSEVGDLELAACRGEDVPRRVLDDLRQGKQAYGLTGDDLYDEFRLFNQIVGQDPLFEIDVLNTYDWFDEAAKFKRPALCLLTSTGSLDQFTGTVRAAVNGKYEMTSRRFLDTFADRTWKVTVYSGDTERTVTRRGVIGANDVCVDIVYSGKTQAETDLQIAGIARFSDIVLVGSARDPLGKALAADYQKIAERARNPTDSYTSNLLADRKKARDKWASESAEVFAALEGAGKLPGEMADMLYALNVLMVQRKVTPEQVAAVIRQRVVLWV